MAGAELGKGGIRCAEPPVAEIGHEIVDGVEGGRHCREITVQPAEEADARLAGLRLGLDPGDPRPGLVDDVIDLAREALQDHVANLLGFFDRAELVRQEHDIGPGRATERGGGEQRK